MMGYIVNLNRSCLLKTQAVLSNIGLKNGVAGRHEAAISVQSKSFTLKNTDASYKNARWCKQYIKSSLCFNVIQFLGGENCDFDVTGAQKQIRLAIDILSNFL